MQDNQPLHGVSSCLLHDFQREQLKLSLTRHKIVQELDEYACLVSRKQPHTVMKKFENNRRISFERTICQILNFVCPMYASHVSRRMLILEVYGFILCRTGYSSCTLMSA